MFYEGVLKALNKKGVKYVVVGGIALNLHGVPRTTADLDLMVELKNENLKKIAATFKEIYFKPKAPVAIEEFSDVKNLEKWNKEKNMEVFTFWNSKKPYEEVDILIRNPISFEEADENKEIVEAGAVRIPIISIEHLIRLKELSNREQDRADIEALKKIKKLR